LFWQPDPLWEAHVYCADTIRGLRLPLLDRLRQVRDYIDSGRTYLETQGWCLDPEYVIPAEEEILTALSVENLFALCYQYRLFFDVAADKPHALRGWGDSLVWDRVKLREHRARERRDPMEGVQQGSSSEDFNPFESLLDRADLPSLEHLRSKK
ncbi:hypothetical protein HDU96_004881, partial [Phlyctochytrium bullatum]